MLDKLRVDFSPARQTKQLRTGSKCKLCCLLWDRWKIYLASLSLEKNLLPFGKSVWCQVKWVTCCRSRFGLLVHRVPGSCKKISSRPSRIRERSELVWLLIDVVSPKLVCKVQWMPTRFRMCPHSSVLVIAAFCVAFGGVAKCYAKWDKACNDK